MLEQLQEQYKAAKPAADGPEKVLAADYQAVKVAEAGLGAFGLLVQFLNSNMLDSALLPNARYEALCEGVSGGLHERCKSGCWFSAVCFAMLNPSTHHQGRDL